MTLELDGKVALVTAASRGLGRASAEALARAGCDLAICSRDQASLDRAAEEIRRATGRAVLPVVADLACAEDVQRVFEAAMAAYGRVDVLVSNTGGPPPGPFMAFDDAAWQGAFDSLLMPAVRLARSVVPGMTERNWGRILFITSSAVKQPIPALVLSNSLRAAVTAMAKTLAGQVAKHGITVNCVAPGRIFTDRVRFLDGEAAKAGGRSMEDIQAEQGARIPVGRYGEPREFGEAVAFLAGQNASYITGSTLAVDGGAISSLL
ncbi:SDR family oxidoreductase [Geothrix fuzhouensis]|uniref:SDR family oxidoreductase n=1 Tax=Geothrix fuzhouensis TaxID=2966451 RepID=UPI0021495367|nr:SDR family oxidoreductase [Geothrix fuzhouensis]